MSNNLEIFGKNLKWLRKLLKMKQDELSKELNISRSNLSYYEAGKNDLMLTILIKASNFFEIPIDDLIMCELDDEIYYKKKGHINKNKSLLNFGRSLKRLRKEKNMYQAELENEIGIAKSNISLYESGKSDITFNSLSKIINYYNITIEDITSFNFDNLEFTKEEVNFFKKFDINIEGIGTDAEFLKLLYNLREYYNKQLDRVSDLINLINNEIPNKLKEIDELIEQYENKSGTKKHN